MSRVRVWLSFGAATVLVACAAPAPSVAEELGDRVRVRIVSRGDVPSITTGRYRLLLQVRGPDGFVESFGVNAPEHSDSESVAGQIAVKVASVLRLPKFAFVESLHGDPELVHAFVLPKGFLLDFAPGRFYALRAVGSDGRMVADLEPEIRFGQITADGSRYVELAATVGPDVLGTDDPPGWPPGR